MKRLFAGGGFVAATLGLWLALAVPDQALAVLKGGMAALPDLSNTTLPTARANLGGFPTINAKTDYGAKGDNTTNDGPALASALAACNPGHPVWLPPGQYKTRQQLTVPAGCNFIGYNVTVYYTGGAGPQPGAVIIADNTGSTFSVGNAVLSLTDNTSVVDGIAVFGLTSPAVDSFKLAAGGVLRRVLAANGRYGILCTGGLTFVTESETALTGNVGVNASCADMIFTRNVVHTAGATAGIYSNGQIKATYADNIIEWNTGAGIYLDGRSAAEQMIAVTGNQIDRNSLQGAVLNVVTAVSMAGNTMRRNSAGGAGGAHIQLAGANTDVQVRGNAYLAAHINDDGSGITTPDYVYDAVAGTTCASCGLYDNPNTQNVGVYTAGTQALLQGFNVPLPIPAAVGGTGVNNGANTLTLGGALATTGSGTIALGGASQTLTFQGTDIYIGRATTDTLTNKTLTSPSITGPTFSGTGAAFTTAPVLTNAVALKANDSSGTPRTLIQMFSDNKTYIDGGAAGVVLRTNNGAATYGTVDAGATKVLVQNGTASSVPTHIGTAQTTAPALTSCGSSPAITGTDEAGIVTMGTSATGCVITFNVAYAAAPYCVVSWIATPLASQSYAVSAAAITTTQTSTSNNKLQYICRAQAGG